MIRAKIAKLEPVDHIFMWTDGPTVLRWLTPTQKHPVFVANRVAEIRDLTTTMDE